MIRGTKTHIEPHLDRLRNEVRVLECFGNGAAYQLNAVLRHARWKSIRAPKLRAQKYEPQELTLLGRLYEIIDGGNAGKIWHAGLFCMQDDPHLSFTELLFVGPELSGGSANPLELPALDGEHGILRALVPRDHAELGAENTIKYCR